MGARLIWAVESSLADVESLYKQSLADTKILLIFLSSGMGGKSGTKGLLRTTDPLCSAWYRRTYKPPKRAWRAGGPELPCLSFCCCLSRAALSLAMPEPARCPFTWTMKSK